MLVQVTSSPGWTGGGHLPSVSAVQGVLFRNDSYPVWSRLPWLHLFEFYLFNLLSLSPFLQGHTNWCLEVGVRKVNGQMKGAHGIQPRAYQCLDRCKSFEETGGGSLPTQVTPLPWLPCVRPKLLKESYTVSKGRDEKKGACSQDQMYILSSVTLPPKSERTRPRSGYFPLQYCH